MPQHLSWAAEGTVDTTAVVDRRRLLPRRVLVIGLTVSALISAASVIYGIYAGRSPNPPNEDALTLYSYASELHAKGEDRSSLAVLRRAKQIARDSSTRAQIERLGHKIINTKKDNTTRRLRAARPNDTVPTGEAGSSPETVAATDHSERPSSAPTTDDRDDSDQDDTDQTSQTAHERVTNASDSVVNREPARGARTPVEANGWVDITANVQSQVVVDGATTGHVTPTRLRLRAGRHTVALVTNTEPGQNIVRQVRVVPGRTQSLRIDIPPAKTDLEEARPSHDTAIGTVRAQRSRAAIGLIGSTDPLPTPTRPH